MYKGLNIKKPYLPLYISELLVYMLYFIHKTGQIVYYTQAKHFNRPNFTTPSIVKHHGSFSLFILDWPPWPHSMIIIGWLISKPRTEAIGTLCSVPLLCYISYLIPPPFISQPSSLPTPPNLCAFLPPRPSPPLPNPSPPLSRPPPAPSTSKKPSLPASKQIAKRGS